MKYRVRMRATIEKDIVVDADDLDDAHTVASEQFDPTNSPDYYADEVVSCEPEHTEPPNDDLASQAAARDEREPGLSKDDYMESGIDFQDPQWDQ